MFSSQKLRYACGIAALSVLLWGPTSATPAIPMDYCSGLNTASMAANSSIYQSDGLCHDFCVAKNNALAVIQASSCWCSDYLPDQSTQVSTSKCANSCPGYPDDVCGGDGYFGYMLLQAKPSGTLGSSPSQTSSTPSLTPTNLSKSGTTQSTVASTTSASSILATGDTVSSTPTLPPADETTPTSTPPSPMTQTVTVGGSVKTVVITPTADPNQSAISTSSSSGGLSTGATVGIVIAVIAVVGLIGFLAVYFCVRRRYQRKAEEEAYNAPSPRGSSAGMTSMTGGTVFSEKRLDGQQGPEHWDNGRRRSYLMPMDPRLDPRNIYARTENRSHESIQTLRDDQDYSRRVHEPPKVLRTTNPDLDA